MLNKINITILFIFCFFSLIFAHPHTFIESIIGIEFENKEPKCVWVEWTFDEMFSAQVIMEADVNKNGRIEPDENDYIYNNAFSNLENYNYFFYQRINDKRESPTEVKEFKARIKGDKLVYKFFVSISNKQKPLVISLIDSTFFCALTYNKAKPVYFINAEGLNPNYKIEQNKNYPVYYNPAGAIDDDRLYTKWQKGLSTAYPEEVVITF